MILIVEDDAESADMLRRNIAQYFGDRIPAEQILIAHDLKTAINMVHVRSAIRVVLLDLLLPDSPTEANTLGYLPMLNGPTRNVIVLSGSGSSDVRVAARRAGARDFIEKPVITEVLVDKLSRLLQIDAPSRELAEVQERAHRELVQKVQGEQSNGDTTNGSRVRRWLPSVAAGAAIVTCAFLIFDRWKGGILSASGIESRVSRVEQAQKEGDSDRKQIKIDISAVRGELANLRAADEGSAAQREALIRNVQELQGQTNDIRKTTNDIWRVLVERSTAPQGGGR